jgi:hypothetical protein
MLPPSYRRRLPPIVERSSETFAVLLFPHEREDVVISSAVRHALQSQHSSDERMIAVGGNFTEEARAFLDAAGVIVLRLSDFHWTDDSYKAIKG